MYVINKYIVKRTYKGKNILIRVFDSSILGHRITKLCCLKYYEDVVTLSNSTDDQINNEIDNLFNIAQEIIDDKSIVNKVKKLFR